MNCLVSQVLPPERSVDWTIAGLKDTTTFGLEVINVTDIGLVGDGFTANDMALSDAIANTTADGLIFEFPEGNFLFNSSIVLPGFTILRGAGAESTTLSLDLNGNGHGIVVHGNLVSEFSSFTQNAINNDDAIFVEDASSFGPGDWLRIIQDDGDLMTSAWAANTFGQIMEVQSIIDNQIIFTSPLRLNVDTARNAYIQKVEAIENVGLECLTIKRIDNTDPLQTSNVQFQYAANCWVNGIESDKCNFAHIDAEYSTKLHVANSYFHHAHGYGTGGKAYGVMLHFASGECLVENNVFEHLRHSMIIQAGANGNVFAYNYSFDPFWTGIPSNSAGDLVIHGNYPHANLFEQNICQNIIFDNSHGLNGPHNTLFRNRAESFGIFFSADNSPSQNMIGNEVPNLDPPYIIFNYTIQGADHFIFGNNDKGTIDPPGTENLLDESYAFDQMPPYVQEEQWAGIGTPNVLDETSIPARDRLLSVDIFSGVCGQIASGFFEHEQNTVLVFPNPANTNLNLIYSGLDPLHYRITDTLGKNILQGQSTTDRSVVDISDLMPGFYMITILNENSASTLLFIKE
ncbi:MAG: T9SS type A sorting domain-containing protein [Flavobacteriales bacterium]|nr:T9SS type A sorting domain-containing protein [Flavobacteriales bacterium]